MNFCRARLWLCYFGQVVTVERLFFGGRDSGKAIGAGIEEEAVQNHHLYRPYDFNPL